MKKLIYTLIILSFVFAFQLQAQTEYTEDEDLPLWRHLVNPPWNYQYWSESYGTTQNTESWRSGGEAYGTLVSKTEQGHITDYTKMYRTVLVDPDRVAEIETEIITQQQERHIVETEIRVLESEITSLTNDFNDYLNGGYQEYQDKSAPDMVKVKVEKQTERQEKISERDEITSEIQTNINEMITEIQNTEYQEQISSHTTTFYHYVYSSN